MCVCSTSKLVYRAGGSPWASWPLRNNHTSNNGFLWPDIRGTHRLITCLPPFPSSRILFTTVGHFTSSNPPAWLPLVYPLPSYSVGGLLLWAKWRLLLFQTMQKNKAPAPLLQHLFVSWHRLVESKALYFLGLKRPS